MTKKQMEIIKDNLRAYEKNFGYIKIVKEDYGKGFYIYTDEARAEQGSWTQYCYNIIKGGNCNGYRLTQKRGFDLWHILKM